MAKLVSASASAWAAIVALAGGYVLVDLIAAAPDSPLVPPLVQGDRPAGWMARAASALALDRLGRTGLTALSLVVMAVLLGAFAVLLVEAWRRRVGVGPVAVAGVAVIGLAVLAPVLLSRDVYSYAAYARIAAVHGENPYVTPPSAFPADPFAEVVSPKWLDTRSRYGPLFTLVGEGVVRSASNSGSTVIGFKVLAAVGLLVAAGFGAAAAAQSGRAPPAFAAAAALLNPVLVIHTVGGGHNDTLVAAFLAAAAYLAIRTRASSQPWGALAVTALLTFGALIKVTAGIVLLVWLWSLARRQRDSWLRTVVLHAGVAAGVAAIVTVPYYAGARTPAVLANVVDLQGWASPARLVARGAEAVGNLVGASVGDALSTAVYAAFLAVFAWALLRLLRGNEDSSPASWGVALVLFALAAPYLLPWYVAWFIPLLPLAADRRFLVIGLAAAGLLATTGIPAEPGSAPGLWRGMVLAVHYVVAPAMLVLLVAALRRPRRAEETLLNA
jgi:alpha-1,6-mannosyltransferase